MGREKERKENLVHRVGISLSSYNIFDEVKGSRQG